MSIELKQAAQQAVDPFDAFGDADDFASLFELTQKMRALSTAIQQAEAQQPATPEPVAFNGWYCAHCQRGVDASEVTYHEQHTACGRVISNDVPPPAPSVPAGYVPVPLQVLRDASEALGNFVSDHGWGDADMQAMDNLDAYIARHDAKAKKGQP